MGGACMVMLPILLCHALCWYYYVCTVPAHAHIAPQPAGHRPYDSVAQEPLHSEDALGQVQEKSQFYHPPKGDFSGPRGVSHQAEGHRIG